MPALAAVLEAGLNRQRRRIMQAGLLGAAAKMACTSGERAYAQGLRNRPTRETARGTLAWWRTLPAERTAQLRVGLSAEREAAALEAWRKSRG